MRLTNDMRRSIVRKVMVDTRTSGDLREQMQARALDLTVERLPRLARQIWNDTKQRGFVHTIAVNICCVNYGLPGAHTDGEDLRNLISGDELWTRLHKQYDEQKAAEQRAKDTLDATLDTYTTVEAFVKAYPELTKYMPAPPKATDNLPASTAVIDQLRAAGLVLGDDVSRET